MDGGVIELFGEGKQRRDLVYVDDVIEALLLAGASEAAEGEVFILGVRNQFCFLPWLRS